MLDKRFLRYFYLGPSSIGVLVTLLLIWQMVSFSFQAGSSILNRIDYLLYDMRFNLLLNQPLDNEHNIIIVDIDEKSLKKHGRWPWSRGKLSELVLELSRQGAVVVSFDMVFSEPERSWFESLQESLHLSNLANNELPKALTDVMALEEYRDLLSPDQVFALSFDHADVVLGFFFQSLSDIKVGLLPEPLLTLPTEVAETTLLVKQFGFTANLSPLHKQAVTSGFVSTFSDSDGIIRRSPLVMQYENAIYPSLSLSVALTYLFLDSVDMQFESIGQFKSLSSIQIGQNKIPTDAKGRLIVPYRGPAKSFPYLSADDVLSKQSTSSLLDNSIVFIGTSAIGLADLRSTPVGIQYPGVEVHANILDVLLGGLAYSRPDWEVGATACTLLVLGLLMSFGLPKLRPQIAVGVCFLALLMIFMVNYSLWHFYHWDFPLVHLLLLVLILTLVNFFHSFFREMNQRRLLKSMFDQYVPPAHIDAMLKNPDQYNFEGEYREMSVMFCDIRAFTTMSEQLSAAELKILLNRFFTPITEVIFHHNGTIDKYVGDMVMAFWSAPLEDKEHDRHAILCALEMIKVSKQLSQEFVDQGLPSLEIGIGINSGKMNVGDMGSTYRRAYTVLGDAVNLGARLESITKFYGIHILVGPDSCMHHDEIAFRHIDRIQVKGKTKAVDVFEPIGLKEQLSDKQLKKIDDHHLGLKAYFNQDWQTALKYYQSLRIEYPNETLFKIYEERILALSTQNLSYDWDGRYVHQYK